MSIKRGDLDASRVDFSEVAIGKRLPLIHLLREDIAAPPRISGSTSGASRSGGGRSKALPADHA
jgi:hypothetical protein